MPVSSCLLFHTPRRQPRGVWAFAALLFALMITAETTRAHVTLYPRPDASVEASGLHRVRVNGEEAFVYAVRVNPGAYNVAGGAAASMLPFTLDEGTATVEVTFPRGEPPREVVVRPLQRGVRAEVDRDVVRLTVDRPGNYCVEFGNDVRFSEQGQLLLFVNPPEVDPLDESDSSVRYFGRGVHDAGLIDVAAGQTVYLAGGAFVKGWVWSHGADDITVRGPGILYGGDFPKGSLRNPAGRPQKLIELRRGRNVTLRDFIALDSPEWNLNPVDSRDVLIDNVKVVGHRPNSDALDPVNSNGLTVRNCYFQGQDDGITLKGRSIPDNPNVRDVLVEGTVMNQNWMRAMVVGGELRDIETVENIVFRDVDVLRNGHNRNSRDNRDAALSVWNVDNATARDVLFEDIRVERCDRLIRVAVVRNQHSTAGVFGHIRDVTFRDIDAQGGFAGIEITGQNEGHLVRDVTLENVRIGGEVVRGPGDAEYVQNAFVRNVHFVSDSGTHTVVYHDPFDQNTLDAYRTSAGRTGLLYAINNEAMPNRNGVRRRLIDGREVERAGRVDGTGGEANNGFSAVTWAEPAGSFDDAETFEVSADFLYRDGEHFVTYVDVDVAGVGISDRDDGVLASDAGATRSGIDVVLRNDPTVGGKGARLVIDNVRDGRREQVAFLRQPAHFDDGRWYRLAVRVTRQPDGTFAVEARVWDLREGGLEGPNLLRQTKAESVANPALETAPIHAGFGFYSPGSGDMGMRAADDFRISRIRAAAAPAGDDASDTP